MEIQVLKADAPRRHTSIGFSTVQPNSNGSPTYLAYRDLQVAAGFFNDRLFGGKLPNVLLTMSRKPRMLGYFGAEFFAATDGSTVHEISLNPAYFESRGDKETLSTLVHELVHLHRHVFGPPNSKGGKGSRGYHDLIWAKSMSLIGLHPTNDGTLNGKQTGYSMTHLIVDGGPFDIACRELLISGFTIRWRDARRATGTGFNGGGNEPTSKQTRARFTCPGCEQRAWAKHSAALNCGLCNINMKIDT